MIQELKFFGLRVFLVFLFFCLFVFVFLGPKLQHMEVPRLGIESELWLQAYTTVTAMPDLSRDSDLHHSSWQCRILNPLMEAMDTSQVLNPLSHTGTPKVKLFVLIVLWIRKNVYPL